MPEVNMSTFPGLLKVAFLLTFLSLIAVTARAQNGCQSSCPSNNGCGGSGFGSDCSFPKGSDPTCTFYNPDFCKYPSTGCPGSEGFDGSCCERTASPILIDLSGSGYRLSDAPDGVWYTPFPKEDMQYQIAWPKPGVQNGWLVLDRNGNGLIDDFGEMFGNLTQQPPSKPGEQPNGFAALAVFDQPDHGGNGDGWISKEDNIFNQLRIWVDLDHDGISQPNELFTLKQVGIARLSLTYHEEKMTDANGNVFKFRSTIVDMQGGEAGKQIYDVFLKIGQSRAGSAASAAPASRDWPQSEPGVGFATAIAAP